SLSGATLVNPRPGPLNTSCKISGLQSATAYYVAVRAIDTLNQIATWSAFSAAATTTAVPTPTGMSLSQSYNQQPDGTLQFYAQASIAGGSGNYDSYELNWQASGASTWNSAKLPS